MSELLKNYRNLSQEIEQAAVSQMPTLVAVSKTQSSESIRVLSEAGHRDFGENYLQEAMDKIAKLNEQNLIWHYIGSIQRNKTRDIAAHFDWVHTIERSIIAERLSKQRDEDIPPLNVCIQVNIDDQDSKSGVDQSELERLIDRVLELPNLTLRGLMCITDPEATGSFERMQAVFQEQQARVDKPDFDTLSMGMSADWQEALKFGATMIRVGSRLFGARN